MGEETDGNQDGYDNFCGEKHGKIGVANSRRLAAGDDADDDECEESNGRERNEVADDDEANQGIAGDRLMRGFRRDLGGEQEEDVVDAKHGDSVDWAVRGSGAVTGFCRYHNLSTPFSRHEHFASSNPSPGTRKNACVVVQISRWGRFFGRVRSPRGS